ncbi:LNS2-domain-containing protein [Phlegmacium glaucopus]|nr:LNS2-domain-containing protein [Phlegmacium glaucopus]
MATAASTFSSAHRLYVKSLYKRYLTNALDWTIRRDIWRGQAMQIRAEFEKNRNVHDPRALASILQKAEADLANMKHPDPYIPPTAPGGTKWERNIPKVINVVDQKVIFFTSMNYIRGAVNVISAPYQYYKDLPPINPSTLTGAIDVIVIQRPADNGATELACSPFHVRFGKWQVLRPGEKKVNVFVNGNPIPFDMKIGEAGEAFFVFETDDDVPADLITSPILQPTIPEDTANELPEELVDHVHLGGKEERETVAEKEDEIRVEPDFLDLDAGSRNVEGDIRTTPKQTYTVPKALRRSSSRITIMQSSSLSLPSQHPAQVPFGERSHTPEMNEQDQRADAALRNFTNEVHGPQVEYHPVTDVTLDMEGYKSKFHDHEPSEQANFPSSNQHQFSRQQGPSDSHSSLTSPSLAQTQSASHSPYVASPNSSPSPSPSPSNSSASSPHPSLLRATSEPPPDMDAVSDTNSQPQPSLPQIQEYSWDWGAFPQPSTIRASFSKGGRIESDNALWGAGRKGRTNTIKKSRLGGMILPPVKSSSDQSQEQDEERLSGGRLAGRSRSVPPLLGGSPPARNVSRENKEYEDVVRPNQGNVDFSIGTENQKRETAIFGNGGFLSASEDDPSTLVLSIDGSKVEFQLSLVGGGEAGEENHNNGLKRSRRGGRDEMEAARLFDSARVDLNRLLDDDNVIRDPRLMIRWARDQYITRDDGSPLMDALVHWRATTLEKRASEGFLELASSLLPPPATQRPQQREPIVDQQAHIRSQSSPPSVTDLEEDKTEAMTTAGGKENGAVSLGTNMTGGAKKPTSSSWVQWWSRSRKKDLEDTNAKDTTKNVEKVNGVLNTNIEGSSSPLPPKSTIKESVPSNPPRYPVRPTTKVSDQDTTAMRHALSATTAKKFAKTLRLTSDQLKTLDLRPGANTITFSLSATGAVAATARIFVWDSTDLVVVSDIDGTITKSDGLGHVFAMIGRDWTHVGVAKLYTDIARNGYKIMYLTSRAIGQADATRDYLKGIKQNNYQLPEGPVIMSPDRLMASLHREVIMRKPEVFKMACLRDIQRLFGESARNPFYAGFGNRITDALSYRSVNVPSARIFTIDSTGEVKMELLELAGYKSSYIHMTDLVDQMFPPIHRQWTPEFTDFNYWKVPLQEYAFPDLSPPSPTLSARSDTSNQSALARLRNFSLGGNSARGGHINRHSSVLEAADNVASFDSSQAYRNSHLRQMSSFEKLSSTLGFMRGINNGDGSRRSASPELSSSSYAGSDDEDGDESELDADGRPRTRRPRRKSMTSMPGTLDETHFDMGDEDEEDQEHDGHYDHDEDEEEEDAGGAEEEVEDEFIDDLLVAGAMQKVPFLYE